MFKRTPKTPKKRRILRITIRACPIGYTVHANVGIFGFYRTIAAVTTKEEAINIAVNTITNNL
jgi:hypothetical protein